MKAKLSNKMLIFGVIFLLFGFLLLLWTTGYIPGIKSLWPVPFVVLGLILLYLVFLRGAASGYIFPGMYITMAGIFMILYNTVIQVENLNKIWPVFMTIAGLSMLPYAYRKSGNRRITYLIPSIIIILLSFLFFPFSTGLLRMNFSRVVSTWWPVIFVGLGVFFIIIFFVNTTKKK